MFRFRLPVRIFGWLRGKTGRIFTGEGPWEVSAARGLRYEQKTPSITILQPSVGIPVHDALPNERRGAGGMGGLGVGQESVWKPGACSTRRGIRRWAAPIVIRTFILLGSGRFPVAGAVKFHGGRSAPCFPSRMTRGQSKRRIPIRDEQVEMATLVDQVGGGFGLCAFPANQETCRSG